MIKLLHCQLCLVVLGHLHHVQQVILLLVPLHAHERLLLLHRWLQAVVEAEGARLELILDAVAEVVHGVRLADARFKAEDGGILLSQLVDDTPC